MSLPELLIDPNTGPVLKLRSPDGQTTQEFSINDIGECLVGGVCIIEVINEVPSGEIDGQNKTFTLAATPCTGTTKVYLGDLRQLLGTDYTESTNTIVFVDAPWTGANLVVDYRKVSS